MPGPLLLKPRRFEDERGWFMESYSETALARAGVTHAFVQDNHSFSALEGTIRGVHFQRPPHAQAKLVRCLRGAIMDYVIDLRRGSPSYGRHLAARLTAEGAEQLYVPVGFGHAFITLEPDVEVAYKVSDTYAPDCEGGVIWNDATLAIDWPVPVSGPVLSGKDAGLPTLAGFDSPFDYEGGPLPLTWGQDQPCAS